MEGKKNTNLSDKKKKKLTEEEADRLVDEFIKEMQEHGL